MSAEHGRPSALLGPHEVEERGHRSLLIRALLPDAIRAEMVLADGRDGPRKKMKRIHPEGLYEVRFPLLDGRPEYCFRYVDEDGHVYERMDPYSFSETIGEFDVHLFREGTHYRTYELMGAHPAERRGIAGVRFALWAPNARGVSVVGDFNRWRTLSHLMEVHESTGIWLLFVPQLKVGSLYKFRVHLRDGGFEDKIDPYGFRFECPPRTASVIFDLGQYRWRDEDWIGRRRERNPLQEPLSIYEVHLGSWKRNEEEGGRSLSYRELAQELVPYVREQGFTHIELLPVTEHPFSASWGYQTTGYFAPTSRFGSPDDFRFFIDTCHRNGIGVLLDWVPAHFPADAHGLALFDGTHLYEHADPRQGFHPDWGSLIFNFGRTEVANFLLSSALFWLEQYHLDGLRVDAVASMLYLDYSRKEGEWLPNRYGGNENLEAIDFLKRMNELVHRSHPGVLTAAEESTAWPGVSRPTYLGGLGFSFKWNMGWMHDSLLYISKEPVYRRFHHNNLTFSLMYAFSENFVLPLSHDEVVHGKSSLIGKMPGDDWQKFANVRLFLAYMFGHPGKKLLFMGEEFGQWGEWNFDAQLEWHLLDYEPHQKLLHYVRDLNRLYRSSAALYQVDFDWQGFEWIELHDADSSVLVFLRRAQDSDDFLIFVCNFTPVPRPGYRVGVPHHSFYGEVFNSDSSFYGGSNMGNGGGVHSEEIPFQGRPYSVSLTLPPLAVLVLKPERN